MERIKRYKNLSTVPLEKIKKQQVRLIFIDMDNTIAPWHSENVPREIASWVQRAKDSGIEAVLLTNSKGAHADRIGEKLGITVVKNAKKPFKRVASNFLAAKNIPPENVLIAGDQLFTDVSLAKKLKTQYVLLEPLDEREWWATKVFNRSRERLFGRFIFKD